MSQLNFIAPIVPRYNVIACIPVHGRIPLLIQTIRRLLDKNGVSMVICVGDKEDDRAVCRMFGSSVQWVQHANSPLGAKWNASFCAAAAYDPDAILFVGSSDWISDQWIPIGMNALEQYDMVGRLDYMMLDINQSLGYRICHWHGYTNDRKGEPIGIGRMLGRNILKKIRYTPFNPTLSNSMDFSMLNTVLKQGGTIGVMDTPEAFSLSVSTDRWGNMHSFDSHYEQEHPSEIITDVMPFLSKHFPESFQIFQ